METAVEYKVEWTPGAKEKLKEAPDTVMYTIARITLDTSYVHIPLSNKLNAGKLRQSSMSAGVRGSNGEYYIGSYTDYANYVWNMGDNTNWTTPGTFGQWYDRVFKEHGTEIIDTAIQRSGIK